MAAISALIFGAPYVYGALTRVNTMLTTVNTAPIDTIAPEP